MTGYGKRFRALLASGRPVVAPGAYDGLSARLTEMAGFQVVYAGGGAIARAAGYPDVGMLHLAEVVERVEKMLDVIDIPLVLDADTGFGGVAHLRRAARLFGRLGVAAFHIEDQVFPKRCGLKEGKEVVSTDEMCRKIRVARDALDGTETLLIARTDAISVEGFQAALDRACAYCEAGAEMIFVVGLQTEAQVRAVGSDVPAMKMIDLFTGMKPPYLSEEEYAALGYNLLIFPNEIQRAMIHVAQKVLHTLKRDGNVNAMAGDLVSMEERDRIARTDEYLALEDR